MNFFRTTIAIPLFAISSTLYAETVVNLNTATVYEMMRDLTGVTKSVAQDIVEYREENGPFTTLEDVVEVEGIGWDFLNINRDYLSLGLDSSEQTVPSTES